MHVSLQYYNAINSLFCNFASLLPHVDSVVIQVVRPLD